MDKKMILLRVGATAILTVLVGLGLFFIKQQQNTKTSAKTNDPAGPAIVGGQLVLPRLDIPITTTDTAKGATALLEGQLGVVSANLVGIFDQPKNTSDSAKLTGIRVLGEMKNLGNNRVEGFVPIVKFFDLNGNSTSRIAHESTNYNFFGADGGQLVVYDITVDAPENTPDKIEVSFKAAAGAKSDHRTVQLKVASRSATIQPTQTQQGNVDVYLVTGTVVNTTESDVADISIITYVKDTDDKVFGISRQDFKSDLIKPGDEIPFKIMVLPVKLGANYNNVEIEVWAKEYKL